MPRFVVVLLWAVAIMAAGLGAARAAETRVVATIVPIHGLVSGVMEGAGEPVLLVPQNASAHTFALRPSQAAALREAQLAFWAGPGVEAFLSGLTDDLPEGTKLITLSEVEGVERLPIREGGAFQPDGHGDEDEDEDETHGDYDAHTWLDPQNAIAMTRAIAQALGEIDGEHKTLFGRNRDALIAEIEGRTRVIEDRLAPFKARKFIIFHDSTQYFERRFGISAAGSLSIDPEIPPGARRIMELRETVEAQGATCVLSEPQFDRRLIEPIVEGTTARVAVIDAEGALITPGPKAYLDLLDAMSATFVDCLNPN
jgi:zinc transport system substrate-binding protein